MGSLRTTPRGKSDNPAGKARQGPRTDVNWEGGSGRQPYSNQGPEEAEEPSAEVDHVPEGNAGPRAGRNSEDLERIKGFPPSRPPRDS